VPYIFRRRSPYGMSRPSVVSRLSIRLSATLLRPTQKIEVLGNILAPSISLGTWAVCINILGKGGF